MSTASRRGDTDADADTDASAGLGSSCILLKNNISFSATYERLSVDIDMHTCFLQARYQHGSRSLGLCVALDNGVITYNTMTTPTPLI
jgi:hypothetical protein